MIATFRFDTGPDRGLTWVALAMIGFPIVMYCSGRPRAALALTFCSRDADGGGGGAK